MRARTIGFATRSSNPPWSGPFPPSIRTPVHTPLQILGMISGTIRRSAQAAARQAPRRNFHATPVRMGGYHYPEGPRSNLPFNPLTKFFAVRYVAFCAVGFGLPFGIAVWQLKKNQ